MPAKYSHQHQLHFIWHLLANASSLTCWIKMVIMGYIMGPPANVSLLTVSWLLPRRAANLAAADSIDLIKMSHQNLSMWRTAFRSLHWKNTCRKYKYKWINERDFIFGLWLWWSCWLGLLTSVCYQWLLYGPAKLIHSFMPFHILLVICWFAALGSLKSKPSLVLHPWILSL